MTDTPTKKLKLTDINLPNSERALLETIMRLTSDKRLHQWQWLPKNAPVSVPVDLLLVDGSNPPEPASLKHASMLLFIGAPPSVPNQHYSVLDRPIRAEQFLAWMVEHTPGTTAQTGRSSPIRQLSALQAPLPSQSNPIGDIPVYLKVKLRRWPSSELLRKDPRRVRMASLLARCAMHTLNLAALSGQSLPACQAFIQDLHHADLLVPINTAPSASTEANDSAAPLQTISKAQKMATPNQAIAQPRKGFFANLRRRLGL